MMLTRLKIATAAAAVVGSILMTEPATAQVRRGSQTTSIDAGTTLPIRTTEAIDATATDGRVYNGVVDEDVLDADGFVAIPAGSTAELIVRKTNNNDLSLDLDSVMINGQRYGVLTEENPVGTSGGGISTLGKNRETATYVGGGALLGSIIGAIAGGGKGAAIGAVAGAAAGAGAQIATHGRTVHIPAETLVTFRLADDLRVGVEDTGYSRDGFHYHNRY
jgi:hypothetical protein